MDKLMNFSKFVKNTVVTKTGVINLHEGIDHIEALPLDKFIDAVKNISKFTATEKLDGANLIFGIDNKGKFYTSREAKSGGKFYSEKDYGDRAADNGFRSAHMALEKVASRLKKILSNGEAVEVEVLYGRQPNAIVYGSSYIAFLRMLPGENKEHPNQDKIKQLAVEMKGVGVTVSSPQVISNNGVDLETTTVDHKWKFTSTSFVQSNKFKKVDVAKEIKELEEFLKEKNSAGGLGLTNMDVIGIKLGSVPKDKRPDVKSERERLIKEVNEKYKLPIKEKFLNEILRKLKPALQDVEIEDREDVGVEGVVLLNPKTLEQLKIVDKDVFTVINQFNFAIRNELKSTSRGRTVFKGTTLGIDGDVFGNMLKRLEKIIGIDGLGEYLSIKRTIRKFDDGSKEATIKKMAKAVKEKDMEALKNRSVAAINKGLTDIKKGLKKYHAEWKSYKLKLKTGKEISYTQEIHDRTHIVFAEVQKEMLDMIKDIKKSKNIGAVLVSLYGKQIKSL